MIEIKKANLNDLEILLRIGKQTFIESHGHSCSKKDLDSYIKNAFNIENFTLYLFASNKFFKKYFLFIYKSIIIFFFTPC